MASTKIKIDVNRLHKEELIYELTVRGLGGRSDLTVEQLRALLRSALDLEKTTLAIKNPPTYPYSFEMDAEALKHNLESIDKLIDDFSGVENDSRFKGIVSKIAHSLGRVNRSNPKEADEKKVKSEVRLNLLLAYDKLKEKVKKEHKGKDSTILDLSVMRHALIQPGAHSSAMGSDLDSSEGEEVKIKPVPVRDWGLKFTGKKGDMSFSSFIERVEDKRRSRGISRAILFRDAVDLFESDAYIWYNMVKEWATDWNSLVELMREQFLPENFDRDLFEEIKRRYQGEHENIGLYIASMKGLFNKMRQPVPEETQLEIIIERIDAYYHPFLAFEQVASITQLLSLCRRLDTKRRLAKSYMPPPLKSKSLIPELAYAASSSSSTSVGSSRQLARGVDEISEVSQMNDTSVPGRKCWNCGGAGHLSTRCSQPQKRYCYSCGQPNVTVRNCPKCSRRQGNGPTRR